MTNATRPSKNQALYRKYRSKSLDDVIGQDHVTTILKQSLKKGRIAHAYLLTGPRGVGKTSIARILAHEINKLDYDESTQHLDIIEIDAASNNGVDDVRDLREKAAIAPVSAKKKIYIIDEVHMLSKPAFNALLKTLEEPPEHIVFILATTDVNKLPDTIISRTQQFSLHTITQEKVIEHLRTIAKNEGIQIDDEALALIASKGGGSFRDSISLLDQLSGLGSNDMAISRDVVEAMLGAAPRNMIDLLLKAVDAHDLESIGTLIDTLEKQGVQPSVLVDQLVEQLKHLVATKPKYIELLDMLLEAPRSSHPFLKIMITLMRHAQQRSSPKTVALESAPVIMSAPIKSLEKKAVSRPLPSAPISSSPKTDTPVLPEIPASHKVKKQEQSFNWTALVEFTRTNHVAIYSVLSKCTYEYDGDTLTLYAGSKFYKSKLDDAKYRPVLASAVYEACGLEPLIETIPSPRPPKDSHAAAAFAIMGGGEEVDLTTDGN